MQTNTSSWSARQLRQLDNALSDYLTSAGYDLFDIPVIEPAQLFLTRAGDKIIDRLFTFPRGDQQFALRPEFTAAAASRYIARGRRDVARWQFIGPIFEDNPHKKNETYQRRSIGAELIGTNGELADAEIIALAARGIRQVGAENWELTIGHVGLQMHLLSQFAIDSRTLRLILGYREAFRNPDLGKAYVLQQVERALASEQDRLSETPPSGSPTYPVETQTSAQTHEILDVLLDSTQYGTTMGGRTRYDIAERLLRKRERSLEKPQIKAALDFMEQWSGMRLSVSEAFKEVANFLREDDHAGRELLNRWQRTVELLEAYGIPEDRIIIQPDLTRNWEYYSGIVFGIRTPSGEYGAGGGRYDELTRLLGSRETIPAVGFAYYIDTLLDIIPPPTAESVTVSVVPVEAAAIREAIHIVDALRAAGLRAAIDSKATISHPHLTVQASKQISYRDKTYTSDNLRAVIEDLKADINA